MGKNIYICCRCRCSLSDYLSLPECAWFSGCSITSQFLKQTRFYYPGEYAGDPSTPLCNDCWDYLNDRESRKAIDKEHFNVAHDTSSRHSPLCREFDIKYGLLDESTERYWDEKPVRLVRRFSQENRQRRQNQWNGNHQNQNLGNLFHKNANELIRNGSLFRQSGTAAYEMVKTAAMKGSQPDFVSSFQAYIVHLGLAISDVCTKKFHGKKFYTNALGYICKAILHDNYIYNELFGINALGNTFKHDTGYIRADINRFLTHYNTMIDKLISVSGCPIFKKCHVYAKPFRKFRSQMRRHR